MFSYYSYSLIDGQSETPRIFFNILAEHNNVGFWKSQSFLESLFHLDSGDFGTIPNAPIITATSSIFSFHICFNFLPTSSCFLFCLQHFCFCLFSLNVLLLLSHLIACRISPLCLGLTNSLSAIEPNGQLFIIILYVNQGYI